MLQRKLRAYVDIPTHSGPDVTENLMITDISLSGCLLRTDMQLSVGETLSLSLPLPGGKMLRLEGKIARAHDAPNGFGISFKTMSDDDRKELALLIAETNERMS